MVRIKIITFGCAINKSDSEVMSCLLEEEGHLIVDDDFDIVIINSCTVKNLAEQKMYKEIGKFSDKKIIVAGCVPKAEESLIDGKLKDYSIISPDNIMKICDVVSEVIKGDRIVLVDDDDENILKVNGKIKNIDIVPINKGCLGNCYYCKTKSARGDLKSYPVLEIVDRVRLSVDSGCKQILLTSQDTGCYGLDIGTNIIELLERVLSIEGDFKVRLGMMNPQFAKKYLVDLVRIFKNSKMFKFIHIPMQSFSDKVIKEMNRNYTFDDFVSIVSKFREEVDGVRISTDLIVGYPTEGIEDFEFTKKKVIDLKINVMNISRFWKRPGTVAHDLKQVDSKEIKRRSNEIIKIHDKNSYLEKKSYLGKEIEVSCEGIDDKAIARTDNYIKVFVKGDHSVGDRIKVKIIDFDKWHLKGEIL